MFIKSHTAMTEPFAANSPEQGFCRDCLSQQKLESARRCRSCGSPRLVRHSELYKLSLAHVDCDAFYASVEKRDNPDIRDKLKKAKEVVMVETLLGDNIKDSYFADMKIVDHIPVDWSLIGLSTWEKALAGKQS